MKIPRVDTHIHATRYRADKPKMEVTVAACIERCVAEGMEYVGIVEHLGGWRHPIESLVELMAEFRQLDPAVPVAVGMEVGTHDAEGALHGTQAEREAVGLDFVMVESSSSPDEVRSVDAFIEFDHRCQMAATTENPWVDVIVHPWTTHSKRLQRAGYEGEWEFSLIPESFLIEWADALATHNTACEINKKNIDFFEDPLYQYFIDELVKREVRIAVGSDAHRLEGIGSIGPIYDFLEARNVPSGLTWFPEL